MDAAFVFGKPPINSVFQANWVANFGIVVVAPYHWKNQIRDISLEKLSGFPWIWTDDRCPFNYIAQQLFKPLGRLPEKTVVVDHDATIRKMVSSGAGLSLMVEPEAIEAAQQKQAVILGNRIADLELFLLYLAKRSNELLIKTIDMAVCKVWQQPLVEGISEEELFKTLASH